MAGYFAQPTSVLPDISSRSDIIGKDWYIGQIVTGLFVFYQVPVPLFIFCLWPLVNFRMIWDSCRFHSNFGWPYY